MKKCLCLILAVITVFLGLPAAGAETLYIKGEAGIIIDFDTEYVIYEKNADSLRAPASMTKLMTLYSFFSRMDDMDITLDTNVTISKNIADFSRKKGYSNVPFDEGASVSVDTLLRSVCVASGNAAAAAIGEFVAGSESDFVQLMNSDAEKLGLTARFYDASGVNDQNSITPRSMAHLCRALIREYPIILEYTSLKSFTYNAVTYTSTNKLLDGLSTGYPGTDGFKTGYTYGAGYCLAATAQRGGSRIIAVTMGCPKMDDRVTDGYNMLRYGFRNVEETVESIYCIEAEFEEDGDKVRAVLQNVEKPFQCRALWYQDGREVACQEYVWAANGTVLEAPLENENVELVLSAGRLNVLLS